MLREPYDAKSNLACSAVLLDRQKAGLVLGRYVRSLVCNQTVPLSSPSRIPWQAYSGVKGADGDYRADAVYVGCHRDIPGRLCGLVVQNGTTVIQFDLRKHDFQQELGTKATLCWRKESYPVDVHELSTFHHPMTYRFIVAQGSYVNDKDQRMYFTPTIKGVSTSQL